MINEEMANCARINFENFEKTIPAVLKHPYYRIAKAQLDEACGVRTMEEALGPAKVIGTAEFKEDGTIVTTGCIASVKEIES